MPIASVNPATGERLRSFDEERPEIVERKVAQAAAAWERWRQTPIASRAAVLSRAA